MQSAQPITRIDLNADLGEGYGAWRIGADDDLLALVTSANIACGGHAGDAETMVDTLLAARARGVVAGAHPGYADRAGFGRRIIPMTEAGIGRMVATQIGALMGAAALAGVRLRYVKLHGALANLAAEDRAVADSVFRAVAMVSRDLAVLAMSGSEQMRAAVACGLDAHAEIFADRAYLPDGRLVPRHRPGAVIHDADQAAARLLAFLETGWMPVQDAPPIRLAAQSVCIHGDTPDAVAMARRIRTALTGAGVTLAPFLPPD